MDFVNQIIQVLEPTLLVIITAVASYVATKIKNTLEQKANNETAKQVITDTVNFVQQVYKDLDGQEKLVKATEKASNILTEKGINISSTEINMLIESAVYGIKQGINKEEPKQLSSNNKEEENEG